jgi:hypothetical protein
MPSCILLNKTALAKCNKNLQIKDDSNDDDDEDDNKDRDDEDDDYREGKKG